MLKRYVFGAVISASCSSDTCPIPVEPVESLEEKQQRLGANYENCREVIPGHNDIRFRRINIVFTGANYETAALEKRIDELVGCSSNSHSLLSMEPFRSNTTNFNFWYVPHTAQISSYDEGFFANGLEALMPGRELARECNFPEKAVVVLPNWHIRSNAGYTTLWSVHLHEINWSVLPSLQEQFTNLSLQDCRNHVWDYCFASADTPICNDLKTLRGNQDPLLDRELCNIVTEGNIHFGTVLLSTYDYANILAHELGHSVGGLHDEYLEEGLIANEEGAASTLQWFGNNCFHAETKEECEANAPWDGTCYQGCLYSKEILGKPVWRSIENGRMRDSWSDNFGKWNEKRLCDVIDAVSHNAAGVCSSHFSAPAKALPENTATRVEILEESQRVY